MEKRPDSKKNSKDTVEPEVGKDFDEGTPGRSTHKDFGRGDLNRKDAGDLNRKDAGDVGRKDAGDMNRKDAGMEGEGSYTGTRDYDRKASDFARQHDTGKLGREAQRDVEKDPRGYEDAEGEGKRRIAEEDPEIRR